MKLEKALDISFCIIGLSAFLYSVIALLQSIGDLPSGHAVEDLAPKIVTSSVKYPASTSSHPAPGQIASMVALEVQ